MATNQSRSCLAAVALVLACMSSGAAFAQSQGGKKGASAASPNCGCLDLSELNWELIKEQAAVKGYEFWREVYLAQERDGKRVPFTEQEYRRIVHGDSPASVKNFLARRKQAKFSLEGAMAPLVSASVRDLDCQPVITYDDKKDEWNLAPTQNPSACLREGILTHEAVHVRYCKKHTDNVVTEGKRLFMGEGNWRTRKQSMLDFVNEEIEANTVHVEWLKQQIAAQEQKCGRDYTVEQLKMFDEEDFQKQRDASKNNGGSSRQPKLQDFDETQSGRRDAPRVEPKVEDVIRGVKSFLRF